jgi:hypothetical protein
MHTVLRRTLLCIFGIVFVTVVLVGTLFAQGDYRWYLPHVERPEPPRATGTITATSAPVIEETIVPIPTRRTPPQRPTPTSTP